MESGGDAAHRIVEAALSLWREGGFGSVTSRAVAARAGVNEVTIFRHFGSKDGLVQAMVDQVIQRFDMGGLVAESGVGDLVDDLEHWAAAYLTQMLPVGDIILLGLFEAKSQSAPPGWPVQFAERVRAPLTRHLHHLRELGRVRDGPLEAVAAAFYAALFARVITAHIGPPVDVAQLARQTARVFAAALDPGFPVFGGG
jgi:AcrR family transcriptional regulator